MEKILYTSDGNNGHTTSPRSYLTIVTYSDATMVSLAAPATDPPSTRSASTVCPTASLDTEQKKMVDLCKEIDTYIVKKYPNLSSRCVSYYEDSMEKILYVL